MLYPPKPNTLLLAIFILATAIYSCAPAPADESNAESQTNRTENPDPAHNSQISLDWSGRYAGNLPCADCESIETVLELRADYTFTRMTRYTGKSREFVTEEGKFEFTDSGNYIALSVSNPGESPFKYKVNEGALVQMDLSGNAIEGDMARKYILAKQSIQENKEAGIADTPWKLVELNGKPVKFEDSSRRPPYLIIGKDDNAFKGFGGCNNIFGQFQLKSQNGITFGRIGSSTTTCEHQRLEVDYMKMLEQVDNYTLGENSLVLNNAQMAPVARFEPFLPGAGGRR